MKTNHRLIACLLLIGLTVSHMFADQPTTKPTTSPSSTIPDSHNWYPRPDRITQWEDYSAMMQGKKVDYIFIGDSITEGWRYNMGKPVWKENFADKALAFGVGSDKTQNVIWRLQNLDLKSFHPKVAIILIGTNNTSDTPQDIATGVKAVANTTQKIFPGIKIVLQSILPNARQTQRMEDANKIIQTFADDKTIFYLDLASQYPPDNNGNWKGLQNDKLHLTKEGYEVWANTLNPFLEKIVGK